MRGARVWQLQQEEEGVSLGKPAKIGPWELGVHGDTEMVGTEPAGTGQTRDWGAQERVLPKWLSPP